MEMNAALLPGHPTSLGDGGPEALSMPSALTRSSTRRVLTLVGSERAPTLASRCSRYQGATMSVSSSSHSALYPSAIFEDSPFPSPPIPSSNT